MPGRRLLVKLFCSLFVLCAGSLAAQSLGTLEHEDWDFTFDQPPQTLTAPIAWPDIAPPVLLTADWAGNYLRIEPLRADFTSLPGFLPEKPAPKLPLAWRLRPGLALGQTQPDQPFWLTELKFLYLPDFQFVFSLEGQTKTMKTARLALALKETHLSGTWGLDKSGWAQALQSWSADANWTLKAGALAAWATDGTWQGLPLFSAGLLAAPWSAGLAVAADASGTLTAPLQNSWSAAVPDTGAAGRVAFQPVFGQTWKLTLYQPLALWPTLTTQTWAAPWARIGFSAQKNAFQAEVTAGSELSPQPWLEAGVAWTGLDDLSLQAGAKIRVQPASQTWRWQAWLAHPWFGQLALDQNPAGETSLSWAIDVWGPP